MKVYDTLLHLMAVKAIQALRVDFTPGFVLRAWKDCNYELDGDLTPENLTPERLLVYAEEVVQHTGVDRHGPYGHMLTGWVLGAWATIQPLEDLAFKALEEKCV